METLHYYPKNTMHPDKHLGLTNPYFTTWGPQSNSEASWFINPPFHFTSDSTEEINSWFAASLHKTLKAFSHLIRVWEIGFYPLSTDPKKNESVWLQYELNSSYKDYINRVFVVINQFEKPIYGIDVATDLFVYIHTDEEQKNLTQGWVRGLADFRFWGDLEDEYASLSFNTHHTLFHAFSPDYGNGDNRQIHSLNQPLLSEALHAWENSIGEITEFNGPKGCYRYGFLSNAIDYGVAER